MRSARLLAIVMHLQHRGRATAPELARELEVSTRTIYRDVCMLQAAGVPLWTEAGRDGGVRLTEGWRSPVDGFTVQETMALVIGRGGAADLGLGAMLAAAQSKVRSGLPAATREQLDAVAGRFHLDQQGWFSRPDAAGHLPAVAHAVWEGRRLDVDYRFGERLVPRRLDPLGLVLKAGTWYLVASTHGVARSYRVGRMERVSVLEEAVSRPDGFDLAGYWQTSADAFDTAIRRLPTVLRVTEEARWRLTRAVPGSVTVGAVAAAKRIDDGRYEVELAVESTVSEASIGDGRCSGRYEVELAVESTVVAVTQLSAVTGVEVVEPEELRAALAAHGRAVAALNC